MRDRWWRRMFCPKKIQGRILSIRGVQVMLDRDLAELYGVPVKRLNEQVSRNIERFPAGFMFQLSASEFTDLKSQIATSNPDFMFRLTKDECLRSQIATLNMERGKHLKYMPYAFTESGVAMLSGVSDRCRQVQQAESDAHDQNRWFISR